MTAAIVLSQWTPPRSESRPSSQATNAHTSQDVSVVSETLSTLYKMRDEVRAVQPVCSTGREVLVTFNACVDLILRADELFEALLLNDKSGVKQSHFTASTHDKITSIEDLIGSFTKYSSIGAATEKFCYERNMFDDLISIGSSLPSSKYNIGGNAAIMASRISQNGCSVTLGSLYGDKLSSFLGDSLSFIPSLREEKEDIHLIIEYPKGTVLTSPASGKPFLTSPRANRYILTMNQEVAPPFEVIENSIPSRDDIEEEEREKKKGKEDKEEEEESERESTHQLRSAYMLVVSGFHMYDGVNQKTREVHFDRISSSLRQYPFSHVEVASMSDLSLLRLFVERVLPNAYSVGANEQETLALYDIIQSKDAASDYDTNPLASEMIQWIEEIMDKTEVKRFHMHSLSFQIICQRGGELWQTHHSLIEATLTATEQACGTTDLSPDMLEQHYHSPSSTADINEVYSGTPSPISCHGPASKHCCVIPVLVCKKPVQTVGLGDHISSSGLSVYI